MRRYDADTAGGGVCLFDDDSANTPTPNIILTADATAINVMKCSDNACSMDCVSVDSIPLQDLGSCTDGSTVGPLYTGLSFKSMYVPDAGGLTPVVNVSPSVTTYLYKDMDCLLYTSPSPRD